MQRIGVRRGYYPYFEGEREDALVMRCALPLASGRPPQLRRADAAHAATRMSR